MDLDFRCEVGKIDIRDYSLIDALKQIGQEKGEVLKFAVWDYKFWDSPGNADSSQCAIYNPETLIWEKFNSEDEAIHQCLQKPEEYTNQAPGGNLEEQLRSRIIKPVKTYDSTDQNQAKHDFKQYPVTIASAETNPEIKATSVFIPLNFRSTAFTVELVAGKITLKDGQGETVGSLELKKGKTWRETVVEVIPPRKDPSQQQEDSSPLAGALVVSQSGQLILKPSLQDTKLLLGQGFVSYEMDPNDWSPVEDQAPAHLCAANAGVALLEYFERMTDGRHLNASRLFLHKAACNLANLPPTAGVSVRSVVSALSVFGVPPESSWPYDLTKLEEEPPAWCYAQARNFRASSYLRLDRPGIDKTALIAQAKVFIYSGLPIIFGFSVHESVDQSWRTTTSEQLLTKVHQVEQLLQGCPEHEEEDSFQGRVQKLMLPTSSSEVEEELESFNPEELFYRPGDIAFPTFGELYRGGHAAIAIGYDDQKVIVNSNRLRPSDREKLRRQNVKTFLINDQGQLEEYVWADKIRKATAETYIRAAKPSDHSLQQPKEPQESQTLDRFRGDQKLLDSEYAAASGMFILLVKRKKLACREVKTDELVQGSLLLTPKDILVKNRTSLFADPNRRSNGENDQPSAQYDEYIVEEYLATKGAFKIRNSWGKDWGEKGYGWLPYTYVYQDLTFDWWSILKFEWMNTEEFGLLRDDDNVVICRPETKPKCPD